MENKKGVKIIVDKNKVNSKNVNKLIKLSLEYIDKLNEAESVRPAKIKFATSGKYEKASIERAKELKSLSEANEIFKKMNKVRKLIKEKGGILWNLK
ncbi:MAG: hypothetical protein IPJ01_10495 [Micavibrio sp.]|nr:hypothetical protein [Micavibrio sp.]